MTRPLSSVLTPLHSPIGLSLNQLSLRVQFEPFVELYRATNACLSAEEAVRTAVESGAWVAVGASMGIGVGVFFVVEDGVAVGTRMGVLAGVEVSGGVEAIIGVAVELAASTGVVLYVGVAVEAGVEAGPSAHAPRTIATVKTARAGARRIR